MRSAAAAGQPRGSHILGDFLHRPCGGVGSGDVVMKSDAILICRWLWFLLFVLDEEDCGLAQYIFDRLKGELVGEEELVIL
jgi:hypothetical protein